MNDLAWAVTGAVLWVILGGAALVLIYIVTALTVGISAFRDKALPAILGLIGGIILWFGTLVLVVVNTVLSIVNVVTIANGG